MSVLTWQVADMHLVEKVEGETAMLEGRMMFNMGEEAIMVTLSEEEPRTRT